MTGNGSHMKILKFLVKTREIILGELIFGEFWSFETIVASAVHIARTGACAPNAHCQGFQISSLRSLASSSWDFFPSYYYITAVCSLGSSDLTHVGLKCELCQHLST